MPSSSKDFIASSYDFNSLSEPKDNIDDLVQKLNLTNNLNIILGYINLTSNTSTECIQNIDKYYRNQIEKIEKLYEGSSKGFVDMNSFLTCINDKENTYFSIYPNWTKEARLDIARLNEEKLKEHLWIFGVCLQNKFCSSKDIAEIFNELNITINYYIIIFYYYYHKIIHLKLLIFL